MKNQIAFLPAIILFQLILSCSTPGVSQPVSAPQKSIKFTVAYPVPDKRLGEFYHEKEVENSKKIIEVIEAQLNERYSSGKRVLRDAHPKAYGCVKADFTVEPSINPLLAKGVFAPKSHYKAVIRYSKMSADPTVPDIEGDGQGMAVKLLDVPGKKLLDIETEAMTQDLIMINHPVFFMSEPDEYLNVIDKAGSSNIFAKLSLLASLGSIKNIKIVNEILSKKMASPLQTSYFSAVPYQLGQGEGRIAVRYKAEPCSINGKYTVPKETKDANYLSHRLREHFEKKDACFTIFAQVRKDETMSVEDSTLEWNSPWEKMATLQMNSKDQDLPATLEMNDPKNVACDTLSFNPWHSLPDHKPLGAMNRMRKVIYERISFYRHKMNKEVRKEP